MKDLSVEQPAANVDLPGLRHEAVTALCVAATAICWIWITVLGISAQPPPLASLLPPVIMMISSVACLCVRDLPQRWRGPLFVSGLSLGFLLPGLLGGVSLLWVCYQSLLVSVAALLVGRRWVLLLASIPTAASLACLLLGMTGQRGEQLWPGLALLWGTVLASWLASRNLYAVLWWAMDSQRRAWQTANEVRERRGELRGMLDSLRTTYGILERTTHELEAARAEAEEAREVKSRFVANVSHELRTPLNIIVGFAEMLNTAPEMYGEFSWPPDLRADVLTIWQNARHLLSLVDDVLDLAQIEASHLPMMQEPTDLIQLVGSTLATAAGLLRDSHVELRGSLPAEFPMLLVDSTRIRQVLLNLIKNAASFTDQGCIEVGAFCSEDEATVYVRDSGAGIPRDRLEAIFNEFEQVNPSCHRHRQGAGLGLAICRQLVRLHGGRIWVDSTLGEGSTFYFTLPLPRKMAKGRVGDLYHTKSESSGQRQERGTVVAVLDDPPTLRILERHLPGLRVAAAKSLTEVAQLVETEHPQAIVLIVDSQQEMAEVSGRAHGVLDALAPLDLPIVACSLPTERRACLTLGAAGFLLKPITARQLLTAVRNVRRKPSRILVVDDEPDYRRLLSRILRGDWPEAEVLEAASGRQAVAMLARHPDLILLDLLMPEMGGIELLKVLRSDSTTAGIPVIVISAQQSVHGAEAMPADEFLVFRRGSFSAAELMPLIDSVTKCLRVHYASSRGTPSTPATAPG